MVRHSLGAAGPTLTRLVPSRFESFRVVQLTICRRGAPGRQVAASKAAAAEAAAEAELDAARGRARELSTQAGPYPSPDPSRRLGSVFETGRRKGCGAVTGRGPRRSAGHVTASGRSGP